MRMIRRAEGPGQGQLLPPAVGLLRHVVLHPARCGAGVPDSAEPLGPRADGDGHHAHHLQCHVLRYGLAAVAHTSRGVFPHQHAGCGSARRL